MGLKLYIKRGLQYIFSGIPEKIVKPNISYLAPNARLQDKKIVITGGGRGLGYAMAKKFSSEGATVLISGRNEDKLKEVAGVTSRCIPLEGEEQLSDTCVCCGKPAKHMLYWGKAY